MSTLMSVEALQHRQLLCDALKNKAAKDFYRLAEMAALALETEEQEKRRRIRRALYGGPNFLDEIFQDEVRHE